ncbi:unnamed protein product [Aphanomyces euteiches]
MFREDTVATFFVDSSFIFLRKKQTKKRANSEPTETTTLHKKQRTTKKTEDKMTTVASCARRRVRIVPVCEPPRELIAAMVDAGAQKEELEGEDLRIVRIERVGSKSWELYKNWACSLGEVDPMVQAVFAPTAAIQQSCLSPPNAMGIGIMNEANSIINHMAPLLIADFPVGGIPALPGPLANPIMMANIHHAKVAVTALIEAISDPGANYGVINALRPGVYICHVQYGWRGAFITVPVFRL